MSANASYQRLRQEEVGKRERKGSAIRAVLFARITKVFSGKKSSQKMYFILCLTPRIESAAQP